MFVFIHPNPATDGGENSHHARPAVTTNSERLRVDPKEHPWLLAEPTVQADADRERMVEMAFEGHAPPAVFLARNAVLASFATGRPTAVVVDVGHEGTTGER